ncbi:MAG TPA: RdgB/HAM1 family non-canonical purine NTP pyrophosphatase [Pseudomonadales bacterium]
MRVVIASNNAGKLREFRELLAPSGLDAFPLSDFTPAQADETGLSFVENALLKARHAARASGLAAIADDSGIVVDALDGAPGIHSARFAGPNANDAANNRLLLSRLDGLKDAQRNAHYHCALVFIRHAEDPTPLICEGRWHGRVLTAARGTGGFGYDPLMFFAELGKTAAELDSTTKNHCSHRGQALRALLAALAEQQTRLRSNA